MCPLHPISTPILCHSLLFYSGSFFSAALITTWCLIFICLLICLFACLPHTLNWGQELCFVHCLGSTYNNIWHVVGTKKNIFFCSSNKYFLSTHFIMLAPWDVPGWEVGLILHCSDSIGSKHTGHCVEKNSQVSSKLEGWGRGRLISNVWHGPSNGEMCHLCSDL